MTDFDMPKTGTWEQRGGWVVRALARDLNLTLEQAAGLVGNLGFESIGFTAFHEIGQADGVGGYGWAQWTASRRRAFFAWATANHLPPASDEANYRFLLHELRGEDEDNDHRQTVTALRKARTIEDAVFSVGQTFERPGGTTPTHLPGYDQRLKYASRALAGAGSSEDAASAHAIDAAVRDFDSKARSLQIQLKAGGYYAGEIDGDFGPASRKALADYKRNQT